MSATAALSVRDLVAGYEPTLPIVRGASVAVHRQEIVTILGPNGAGKSTLLKAVAGLVAISAGAVRLQGADITGTPAHRMIFEGLAFVPQTENVFASMSVEENLRLAGFFLKDALAGRLEAAYALFPDLARQRDKLAGSLSGGQRQMLAVARATLVEPRVLMLDEPSAGLSPKLVDVVFQRLRQVREQGAAILIVEQNAKAALAISDRGYVLVEGRERLSAAADRLLANPQVAALYLGSEVAPS